MAKLEKSAICNWQNEFDPDDLFAFGATFTEENEIDVHYFNVFVEMESDRERTITYMSLDYTPMYHFYYILVFETISNFNSK